MNWSKGYSAQYYMTEVDPGTWRDISTIQITEGSIKKELESLRESADVTCLGFQDNTEKWIRIYLDADQDGETGHVALFTGLASSPEDNYNGSLQECPLECYSVLKPVEDVALLRGWYAPAGVSCSTIVRQLLSPTPAPVQIAENAPALTSSIIAEEDETNLTMIDKILAAINWRIRLAGDGTISIEPYPTEAAARFDPLENDCIEPDVTVSEDWFSCPNVFMAVNGDLTAIARDDSVDSPFSTVNRGREVWATESDVDLADGESIEEYAARRLQELQNLKKEVEYNRRFWPDVYPTDIVTLYYPDQGLNGNYAVTSQSIDLGYGARTAETLSEV